jgi:hypothetical protein
MFLWRQRCVDGSISEADLTEAMTALRGERKAAASQTKAARTKVAKAAIPNAKSLLDEMEEDAE